MAHGGHTHKKCNIVPRITNYLSGGGFSNVFGRPQYQAEVTRGLGFSLFHASFRFESPEPVTFSGCGRVSQRQQLPPSSSRFLLQRYRPRVPTPPFTTVSLLQSHTLFQLPRCGRHVRRLPRRVKPDSNTWSCWCVVCGWNAVGGRNIVTLCVAGMRLEGVIL